MAAAEVSDTYVEAGRLALFFVMAATAVRLRSLYADGIDRNWVPWFAAGFIHAAYAFFMAMVLLGSDLVLEGWWRLGFTILNATSTLSLMWLLVRYAQAVRLVVGRGR